MKSLIGFGAAIAALSSFGGLGKGGSSIPNWNPNKDHSRYWDKLTRNKNKLNLNSTQKEMLSKLFGKTKKQYLKSIRGEN